MVFWGRNFRLTAGLKSRSAVVEEALKLLAEREAEADLALAYAASAVQDVAVVQEAQATYNDDGLGHEAW